MTNIIPELPSFLKRSKASTEDMVTGTANHAVMLATETEDLGLVPAATAEAEAQDVANEIDEPVTVREQISDKVKATVQPLSRGKASPKKPKTPQVKALNGMTPLGKKPKASIDTPLSNIPSTPRNAKADHRAEAAKLSKGVKVKKVAPTAKELSEVSRKLKAEKAASKAKPAPKGKAAPTTKSAKPKADAQPTGKSAECIKLALRKNGTTAAELNALTGWHGCPWKWTFQNPQKKGWADRFGFKFEVLQEGRTVRYKLTPR